MSSGGANTVLQTSLERRSKLIAYTIIVAFGWFLVGIDAFLFFFGGTFIFSALHVNAYYLGVAAAGYAIGAIVFSMVGGYVFDRLTTRNGILISLAIITLFSALTGFATNKYEVVIYRVLVGFGTGMIQPQIAAFLGEMRPKYRATMIETGLFALFLGLAVAPLIFNHFSTPTTFDIPFLISGASGVVLMLLTVFIVPSKYRTKMNPIRGLLKNIGKPLILAALSYLALGIAFFAYQSYYTPYLIANGISEATASIIVSLFGFAGIALAYPGGLAGDRFNRKYVILLAIILFLIGGVIMFEAPVTIGIMAFGVILFGAGYVIYGNIQAYAQESVESAWASSSNGFILAIFNIGSATGGPLMGTLIVLYGYHLAAIGAVVVPLLVSIGLMGFAPRLKKRTEISQAITEKASGKR